MGFFCNGKFSILRLQLKCRILIPFVFGLRLLLWAQKGILAVFGIQDPGAFVLKRANQKSSQLKVNIKNRK
jgi:hypothetical protein